MEADWVVAMALDDPVITIPWAATDDSGHAYSFVDLQSDPMLISMIEEAQHSPLLRSALLVLNGGSSQLWTAKCDQWTVGPDTGDEPLDPFEMDAMPGETVFGSGSYIDLLVRDGAVFSDFQRQERWLRTVTERLHEVPARAVRVDLVMRHARVRAVAGFAVTWFVEGCGVTREAASLRWAEAFRISLTTIMDTAFEGLTGGDTIMDTGE